MKRKRNKTERNRNEMVRTTHPNVRDPSNQRSVNANLYPVILRPANAVALNDLGIPPFNRRFISQYRAVFRSVGTAGCVNRTLCGLTRLVFGPWMIWVSGIAEKLALIIT